MMGNRKSAWAFSGVVGLALGLLTWNSAYAAGMWNLDQGASHYGRGGANIASPDDPSAVYVNPAALAGLEGFQLMLGVNYNYDSRSFARAPDNEGFGGVERTFEEVSNLEGPSPSPNIFASYNFAGSGLTLGAGLWGPPKTNREFDADGAQRYSSVHGRDIMAHYVMSAAYQSSWRNLRLGASFGGTSVVVDSSLKLNVYEMRQAVSPEKEDPDWDVSAKLSGVEHGIPMGILGASVDLWKNGTLALAFQLPFDVKAEGEVDMEVGEGLTLFKLPDEEIVQGKDITVQLNLPPVLRLAVKQTYAKANVEAAIVWEGWSRTAKTTITPDNITFNTAVRDPIPLPVIELETKLRDTYSFRLGGEYVVSEGILVRGGTYYERAAIGGGRLNPSQFDLDKAGVTLGGRIALGAGLYLDAAVGVANWFEKEVTDSKVVFNDPAPNDPPIGDHWSLGNGTYSNTQIFSMVALGGKFDI